MSSIGIIGAGPSGLSCSLFLNQKTEILEKTTHVGGHAASFTANGFTFDYGPHIIFSKDKNILDFITTSLGNNLASSKRNNKIFYKNRFIKYPFENDLKSLSLADNYDCISSFLFNPYKDQFANPLNMKEWFLKSFGQGICTRYLFPYNEKVWNIPVEKLSMSMANRIPEPSKENILKSSLGYSTEGYLHQLYYFYPKTGGYQAICEAWKKPLSIYYDFDVDKIQFIHNKIRLISKNGPYKDYAKIISTMPIHEIIHKLDCSVPEDIITSINKLIIHPMFVVSLGIKGNDHNKYTAIYFPESDFLVNRISFPGTFSHHNTPQKHWSIQAEITCAPNSSIWHKTDQEILTHVTEGLKQRKIIPLQDEIVFTKVDRIKQSYVVYDIDYEIHAEKIRAWFAAKNIHLLGRFSYFEYINIDMAVDSAIKLAAKFNNDISDPNLKINYLAKALHKLSNPVTTII